MTEPNLKPQIFAVFDLANAIFKAAGLGELEAKCGVCFVVVMRADPAQITQDHESIKTMAKEYRVPVNQVVETMHRVRTIIPDGLRERLSCLN